MNKVDILVVHAEPSVRGAIGAALSPLGENVVAVSSDREALRRALRRRFAVILLDLDPPSVDGLGLAELVRGHRPSQHTPIILLTAAHDAALLGQSYAFGAADVLPVPVIPEVLRRTVRIFADLHRESAELRRRAEALEEETARLRRLSAASLAEARHADTLKDEFLATLSHELRTPLHALLGWTHLLRTGSTDPAWIAKGLEVIERNVNLHTRLIDELLDASRLAAGKLAMDKRPVALGPILEATLSALHPAAHAKGIEVTAALGAGAEAWVLGDAERLQQVFSNLIGNAVKFTPSGGRIAVAVTRHRGDAEVRVTDDGVGMGPEFLPHAFDRLRQADGSSTRAHGGLGLGLSVVRDLVALHGGSVRAESEGKGRGATFVVRFPVAERVEQVPPRRLVTGRDGGPRLGPGPARPRLDEGPEKVPRSGVQTHDDLASDPGELIPAAVARAGTGPREPETG